MAEGDIRVRYDDEGRPSFRMEGYPIKRLFEDVVPGRSTGLRDIDGLEIFDGDDVINLNIPEPLEQLGQARLTYIGDGPPLWSSGGAVFQGISSHPIYGVRKVVKQ